MSLETLPIWVIYDHPTDYPEDYVARQWFVPGGPTDVILKAAKLDMLRHQMLAMGLVCMQPSPEDDPKIVEAWI